MNDDPARRTYYIDSNSLLKCARRFDDLTRFRGVWDPLSELVNQGRLRSPEQVAIEAGKQSAIVREWLSKQIGFGTDTADLWAEAKEIARAYPDIAGDELSTDADPYLIALARRHNARVGMFDQPCVVVTEEVNRKNPQRITRIGEACDDLHIDWRDLWGMFELEGWRIGIVIDD
jgi:hypothetical protein